MFIAQKLLTFLTVVALAAGDDTVLMQAMIAGLQIPTKITRGSPRACGWFNVQCVSETVVSIDWRSFGLAGTINFTSLPATVRLVFMRNNSLSGVADLSKLPAGLEQLDLSANTFSGRFDVAALPHGLNYLNLVNNEFDVRLECSALPRALTDFYLSRSSNVTGTLVWEALPPGLLKLELSGRLVGEFHAVAMPRNMTFLSLINCGLPGTVNVSELPTGLALLEVPGNRLTGNLHLPALPRTLRLLDVGRNQLSGVLDLRALPASLEYLDVSDNAFTAVVGGAAMPRSLVYLYLADNRIEGHLTLVLVASGAEVSLGNNLLCGTSTVRGAAMCEAVGACANGSSPASCASMTMISCGPCATFSPLPAPAPRSDPLMAPIAVPVVHPAPSSAVLALPVPTNIPLPEGGHLPFVTPSHAPTFVVNRLPMPFPVLAGGTIIPETSPHPAPPIPRTPPSVLPATHEPAPAPAVASLMPPPANDSAVTVAVSVAGSVLLVAVATGGAVAALCLVRRRRRSAARCVDDAESGTLFGTAEEMPAMCDSDGALAQWDIRAQVLGRGGQATVRLAVHRASEQEGAAKVYEETGASAGMNEATRMVALAHRHVLAVLAHGMTGKRAVVVTELAVGSLKDAVRGTEHGMTVRTAVTAMRDVAAGLAHVHAQGWVHMDVKPQNVLVCTDGRAVLADFGCAMPAGRRTDVVECTLQYVAPEVIMGGAVSTLGDVWAMGLTLEEMLTGREPYDYPEEGRMQPRRVVELLAMFQDMRVYPFPTQRLRECAAARGEGKWVEAAGHLVRWMAAVEVERRPGAAAVLESAVALLARMSSH